MEDVIHHHVLLFIFYTGRHNFGWAAKGMSVELGISYQQIGWISFSMLMGYAIGQLINGNLADRLSPKIMILTGGSLSIICNLFISYANTYGVILVLWTLNGYFQSMAWGSGSKLISNWWDSNERGKAFGFYTMAAGSSSVLTFLWHYFSFNKNKAGAPSSGIRFSFCSSL